MSLPHQGGFYKEKHPSSVFRLRPVYDEGRCIRAYALLRGVTLKKIADNLGVSRVSVHCVAYGKRSSRRIESEIARVLGKADWNEVVLEARSDVQKKPVSVILQEREQRLQAGEEAFAALTGKCKTAKRRRSLA